MLGVDTGARTSVLHCSLIEQVKRFRRHYVRFIPLDPAFPNFTGQEFVLPYHGERLFKNSFGAEENRFIVLTKIRLFNRIHEIEISLRDRSNLEFPMLLGRTAIRKHFLVDVSRSDLSLKYHIRKLKKLQSQASPSHS